MFLSTCAERLRVILGDINGISRLAPMVGVLTGIGAQSFN